MNRRQLEPAGATVVVFGLLALIIIAMGAIIWTAAKYGAAPAATHSEGAV